VRHVLCSAQSRLCLRRENERVRHKLAHMFHGVLRDHKARRPPSAPNICRAAAALAGRAANVRFCDAAFDAPRREALAVTCAAAIARLMNTVARLCPAVLAQARRETLVVGLLYLMRAGMVVRGTRVLRLVPELRSALPLESYLFPHFGIRCNSVTETENLVKMAARALTSSQIAALGLSALDPGEG
jgi:hypothetical protein